MTKQPSAHSDTENAPISQTKAATQLVRELSSLSTQLKKHAHEAASGLLSQDCDKNESVYHNYFSRLSGLLAHLEKYLWAYCDTNHYNRYEALHFLLSADPGNNLCHLIKRTDDCLIIYMPHLPHRSFSGRNIATEALAALLFRERNLPKWTRWHCAFYHVFPTNLSRLPKDVDNYGYKRVIDLISFAMGVSDAATYCSLFMDTVFTDKIMEGIYIKITPKSSEISGFGEIEKYAARKQQEV